MELEPFLSDHLWKKSIRDGSMRLLAALWREHPEILHNLGARR